MGEDKLSSPGEIQKGKKYNLSLSLVWVGDINEALQRDC